MFHSFRMFRVYKNGTRRILVSPLIAWYGLLAVNDEICSFLVHHNSDPEPQLL
jgi:hypothetical protein